MNKPGIEQKVEKSHKRVATVAAFMGVGISAVMVATTWQAVVLAGMALPVALDSIAIKALLNDRKGFKPGILFSDPLFKKGNRKWLKDYIDNSENLTEKKYKVICLNLWMKHKHIKQEDIFGIGHSPFDNVSAELRQKGETKDFLSALFYDTAYSSVDNNATPATFLDEDKNNPEKLEIAKKVYKEYSEIGMAGKQFARGMGFETLLLLQNYKLNTFDYEVIEKTTIELKKEDYQTTFFAPLPIDSKHIVDKLIDNENNPANLKILGDFCDMCMTKDFIKEFSCVEDVNLHIQKKIDYLAMVKKVGNISKLENPVQTAKKMKI